jgi:hypothetical protein
MIRIGHCDTAQAATADPVNGMTSAAHVVKRINMLHPSLRHDRVDKSARLSESAAPVLQFFNVKKGSLYSGRITWTGKLFKTGRHGA